MANTAAAAGQHKPAWSKEDSVPLILSNGRTIQVSPSFNSLDDRTTVLARTVALHRSDVGKPVSAEAVVAAIAPLFAGKDPKTYIDALYRYEKDFAIICVEFADKTFADKLKAKGEIVVKARDDGSDVTCKLSDYGSRLVRIRLDNVSRGVTAQQIVDLVDSFNIGTVQGIERPTKAVLGSYENLSVIVWLTPYEYTDLAAQQEPVSVGFCANDNLR